MDEFLNMVKLGSRITGSLLTMSGPVQSRATIQDVCGVFWLYRGLNPASCTLSTAVRSQGMGGESGYRPSHPAYPQHS